MKSRAAFHYPRIVAAVASVLGIPLAGADPPPVPPDTSNWKCEQCPFFQGYDSHVEAGVLYANGANAASGRYTGIDHNGAYADADANGQFREKSGSYINYSLDRLGLPSREGYIEGGQEGQYDVKLSYDGQPTRLYDTTVTPFVSPASGLLNLPPGWTASNSTATMPQLAASLHGVDIGFDRRTVDLGGKYYLDRSWTFYANLEHQQKVGTDLTGGAFLTESTQLPEPINYETDDFEVGAAWASRTASARLSYSGSYFQDNTDSLTWDNPFTPVVADATVGRLSLPPSNQLQQVAASGDVRFPAMPGTTLTYGFSYGWLTQNVPFLPNSTLVNAPALPQGSLDGDVRLTHYALGLSSRPWRRLYVRGTATYDGRDDRTSPLTIAQILTDSLPNGTAVTPLYSYDRTRFTGSADYQLISWLRVGAAGQFLTTEYSPDQVLRWRQDARSWGQVKVDPIPDLSFTIKAGNANTHVSGYNTLLLPLSENPLLFAYDYAPVDSNFYSFLGSWAPLDTLTWTVEGTWSDDAYRLTDLGLQQARDRKIASTVTYTPAQTVSVYLEGGYQRLSALQAGSIGDGAPLWYVADNQGFWDAGGGGHWAIARRWDVNVDYIHSLSRGDDTTFVSGLGEPFPENRYTLDSVTVGGTYLVSDKLKVRLRYVHERYDTSDWALGGVGPATVPALLALGVEPDRYTVDMVALTAQYEFDNIPPPTD